MLNVLAPGKVFLAGEYAVLNGAPAVVMAVNRHARAILGGAPPPGGEDSALVRAAVLEARAFAPHATDRESIPLVDTWALTLGGQKIGLGSSAAACVASAAAILAQRGCDLRDAAIRGALFAMARRAHDRVQGVSGSGADIAAAVHGGLFEYRMPRTDEPPSLSPLTLPPEVRLVFAFTGQPASTAALLERRARLAADRRCTVPLADAAQDFVRAARAADGPGLLRSVRASARAMESLGDAMGVALLTPAHQRAATLAASHGGEAKPSGAGGGDLAVAFLSSEDAAQLFSAALVAEGFPVIPLSLDDMGVRQETVP